MKKELRQVLNVHLWQVWEIKKIQIETSRHKYPRETKWVYCFDSLRPLGYTRFLWYEVELIN